MKKRICADCINFIYSDDSKNKIICDFDHFKETPIEKAMLFVPEMFETCVIDYEIIED